MAALNFFRHDCEIFSKKGYLGNAFIAGCGSKICHPHLTFNFSSLSCAQIRESGIPFAIIINLIIPGNPLLNIVACFATEQVCVCACVGVCICFVLICLVSFCASSLYSHPVLRAGVCVSARVYAYALYQFFYFVQAPSTLTLCSEQVCVCVYVCTHMVSTILFGLIVHKLPLLSTCAQSRCVCARVRICFVSNYFGLILRKLPLLSPCAQSRCVCVYVCTCMVSTILFGLIVHKLPLLSLFAQGRCVRVNAWLKHLFNLCVLCVCFLCFCAECVGPFF